MRSIRASSSRSRFEEMFKLNRLDATVTYQSTPAARRRSVRVGIYRCQTRGRYTAGFDAASCCSCCPSEESCSGIQRHRLPLTRSGYRYPTAHVHFWIVGWFSTLVLKRLWLPGTAHSTSSSYNGMFHCVYAGGFARESVNNPSNGPSRHDRISRCQSHGPWSTRGLQNMPNCSGATPSACINCLLIP